MTPEWVKNAFIYHIYPMGLCGAPAQNDFQAPPLPRLDSLLDWLGHIQSLGANTIYLGPVLESTLHGYDTADYFQVDRRLGTVETLKNLINTMKMKYGFRVIFDAVYNHVGRDFWAFQDVLQHGQQSAYKDWFSGLNFQQSSPYGDPFTYDTWAGHYDLVKLNLDHAAVREHLLEATKFWIETFDIDGLRLDAADHIQPDFFRTLRSHCHHLKADFWLMGEVVHGDYRQWANPEMLDATTNYECYKGLYSSHVDRNYFEIAYSLNRQFGEEGMYRDLFLYNFADNHDVNRVASSLQNPTHLYTLYGLLFTMPGIPSIYYGSEWGIGGERTDKSDLMLRPVIPPHGQHFPHPKLESAIQQLAFIRQSSPALKYGSYRQLFVASEQFAFERQTNEQRIIVSLNAASQATSITLQDINSHRLVDLLNPSDCFKVENRQAVIPLYQNWLRILKVEA